MSSSVRRLVLDIGPLALGCSVFFISTIVGIDAGWVARPVNNLPLMPGMLLSIVGAFAAQKVSVWRTLPVTQTDIDRARWWQSVGGPGLLITAAMFGPALVMAILGHPHAAWMDVLLAALAQFAACVAAVAILVCSPLAVTRFGRWGMLLMLPQYLILLSVLMPTGQAAHTHLALAVAGAAAITGASILYLLAGRWPQPLIAPWWEIAPSRPVRATSPNLRGWPAFVAMQLPFLALGWAWIVGMPPAWRLMMPGMDGAFVAWIGPIIAVMVTISSTAGPIRILRALPLRADPRS